MEILSKWEDETLIEAFLIKVEGCIEGVRVGCDQWWTRHYDPSLDHYARLWCWRGAWFVGG